MLLLFYLEKNVNSYKLVPTTLSGLLPLIRRYVDTEPQLELQCLFAIQSHLHKLDFPQGEFDIIIYFLNRDFFFYFQGKRSSPLIRYWISYLISNNK